jgi:P27 family predicted phage terminase small subunit
VFTFYKPLTKDRASNKTLCALKSIYFPQERIMGRRPTPTALKELRGTARAGAAAREPQTTGDLTTPRGLDPDLRKTFARLAADLREMGVVTRGDEAALLLLSMNLRAAHMAYDAIMARGIETIDERGLARKHPLWSVVSQATQNARALLVEFGLTPAARARVEFVDAYDDDGDDVEQMLDELFYTAGGAPGGR